MRTNQPDPLSPPSTGQPLRFMGLLLVLWIGGRVAANSDLMLNGTVEHKAAAIATAALPTLASASITDAPLLGGNIPLSRPAPTAEIRRAIIVRLSPTAMSASTISRQPSPTPILVAPIRIVKSTVMAEPPLQFTAKSIATPPTAALPAMTAPRHKNWSGSAWLFWRSKGSSAHSIGNAGQLGGPQAGVRIERQVARMFGTMPVAPYARLSAALRQPHMPESALGLAVRPLSGPIPVTLGIERRIALDDSSRNAFALVAVTGINPTPITEGLIIEGYAQAGMVGFSQTDPFADGRFALGTPIDRTQKIIGGVSISGGAQPGLSRLDIGPMLQIQLPVKGMNSRLSVEWRERIAGDSRPGSGLAITLGTDF